ncbi:MAG: MBL fold metallo-hydrolase [Candidatus Micrarchaeota archaeon]
MAMKKLFILALMILAFGMLFGCLDILNPSKENQTTAGDGSTVVGDNTVKPKDDGLVIIGSTNQSVVDVNNNNVNNITNGNGVVPQTDGMGYTYAPDEKMAIYFIDVGDEERHGDSILIKKGDFDMLVDAGTEENAGRVVDFLKAHNVDDIDVLVSTSAIAENYGGMKQVLDNFKVEELWYGGNSFNNLTYEGILSEAESKGAKIVVVERGDEKDFNGAEFDILNPKRVPFGDPANDAIVIKITNGVNTFLLTSDIKTGAQGDLMNNYDLRGDVIMVPYHGLGVGNPQFNFFLSKTTPSYFVITGGSNDDAAHGGDRQPLYRILDMNNIPYFATYEGGTIRIISDGSDYTIQYLQ